MSWSPIKNDTEILQELWVERSEIIKDDISSIKGWVGKSVIDKKDFDAIVLEVLTMKAKIEKFVNNNPLNT